MLRILIIFSVCVSGILSQVPVPGNCPKIDSVQQNFDLEKYSGKWYEVSKYFTLFEIDGKCVTAEYSINDNGTVQVNNKQVNSRTGKPSSIIGSARPSGNPDEAKLLVVFPTALIKIEAPYWVLETDYDNYAVIWSCTELPVISTRFAWVLTRERVPSDDVLEKALAVFDKFGISKTPLEKTDQTDCPDE